MDRRSFIVQSATLIAGAWGGCRASFASARSAATVVVDLSLDRSIAFASDRASAGASVASLDGDIGTLWYAHLAGAQCSIAGVLRPSDAFVLTRLATHAGYAVVEQPAHAGTVEIAITARRALG